MMVEDVVRELGYLTLGTRFKRIGERLQSDTQRILDGLDIHIPSSQYPLLAALERLGPLAIGDLAQAIGTSQPGITRSVGLLANMDLVEISPSAEDQRRRIVALSKAGQDLVARAREIVWPPVLSAVSDLCDGLYGPLLEQLAAMEDGLDEKPLVRRAKKEDGK